MCNYLDIPYSKVMIIKELWEKNREYHEKGSEYFSHLYKNISLEDRIKAFAGFKEEDLKISIAMDKDKCVGYCISKVIDGNGELQSIHVSASERGKGIGRKLAKSHLEWMKGRNCKAIGVTVSQENEKTIAFYRSLGFYPNTLYMQQL